MPESPALGDTWTRAGGPLMVYVPAGEFEMGSTGDEVDNALVLCQEYGSGCDRAMFERELPVHTVALDGFWIDRTEVTNAQYAQCVAAGGCDAPARGYTSPSANYGDSAYADHPVVILDWHQATAYCAWAGARLPTEAEWEYAARGPEGRRYPWGDEFDGTRLNFCDVNCGTSRAERLFDDGYVDTAPVGSYPDGVSWCGALDLAGNVWEWTADWYGDYLSSPQVNPRGASSGDYRVLRGGSWQDISVFMRCAYRGWDLPFMQIDSHGFRCARGPD
jgi:formylglycine-generating enzyme required for sulfatase activity